ncbi:MAG: DUF2207 domain-containing protein, partial [Actinomycetota bacterium]
MRYGSRRKLDMFLLGLFGLAVGGLGALGAAIGDSERIQRYWSSAVIDAGQADEQRAQITELIDYDFGSSSRRGILRDVEDLDPGAAVEVSSPTAPDDVTLLSQPGGAIRIRIGDPDITIRGRHQYRIGFPLVVAQAGGPVFWDAIGTGWEVGIEEVELHLTGATEFTDVLCSTGEGGTWGGCTAEQVEPGHLVVRIDGLSAGEGVTISATPGAPLATAPAPPTPPTDVPDDPGTGILPPFLIALGAAIAAAAGLSRVVRRQGREQVWAGGAADAAYGPQLGQDFPTRLVDHDELSQLASIEFTPPKGLTPWQGGVLHREAAGSDQEVAWLLERAIDGTVQIDGIEVDDRGKVDGDLSLTRIPEADGALDPADRDLLDGLFGGRTSITLDSYDKQFAAGWSDLGTHLQSWNDTARFWDPAGDRRRGRARILGVLALLVGVAITIGTAVLANRVGPVALVGVAVGAGIAGAGIGLLTRSWELRVRTPEGSGLWILVESFRRFIEGSEAQHVEDAARQGLLREYTAWATALGEA